MNEYTYALRITPTGALFSKVMGLSAYFGNNLSAKQFVRCGGIYTHKLYTIYKRLLIRDHHRRGSQKSIYMQRAFDP